MTTYYVSTGGSDSYDGLSSTVDGGGVGPFLTLYKANATISSGDTIMVAPGVYIATSSTAIVSFDSSDYNGCSLIGSASGVVITKSGNTGSAWSSGSIVAVYSAYNVTISNVSIYSGGNDGLTFGPTSGSTVSNCDISYHYSQGLFPYYAENCYIIGNDIHHNGWGDGVNNSTFTHGCYIARACFDIMVSGNTFRNNGESGLHINGQAGEITTGFSVHYNKIYSNGNKAMDMTNVHDSSIKGNLMYDNLQVWGPTGQVIISSEWPNGTGATGAFRIEIVSNTFIEDSRSRAIWLKGPEGDEQLGSSACTVFNNIFISTSSDQYRINDGINNAIDLPVGAGGSNYFAKWSTTLMDATFRDWRNGDFWLTDTTPCVGGGAISYCGVTAPKFGGLAVALDNWRPNGLADCGAYESAYPTVIYPPPPTPATRNTQQARNLAKFGTKQIVEDKS